MKINRTLHLISSVCLAIGLLLQFCTAADSTGEARPAAQSLLAPIAYLVDGTWIGRLPADSKKPQASIEMQFAWTANHQAISFNSYFVQGENRSPYTSGMYGWHPGRKKIAFWYTDSEGSLHEGTVAGGAEPLLQEFSITDKNGKVTMARSRLTHVDTNVFTNEISVQKDGDWKKIAEVRYERKSAATN